MRLFSNRESAPPILSFLCCMVNIFLMNKTTAGVYPLSGTWDALSCRHGWPDRPLNLKIVMTAANAVPVERRSVFLERVGAMLKPRGRFSDDDVRQVAAQAMASSEFLAADFSGSG